MRSEAIAIPDSSYESGEPEQVYAPELRFAVEAVRRLESSSWSGRRGERMPLKRSDFVAAQLEELARKEAERSEHLAIPAAVAGLYLDSAAQGEVQSLLQKSYIVFVAHAKERGVAQRYLDELQNEVLPNRPERIVYKAVQDPAGPPTAVRGRREAGGVVRDYSQLELNLYAVDAYNHASDFEAAGLFRHLEGGARGRAARDFGIRFLLYHELTHALQRAEEKLHTPTTARGLKSAWTRASRRVSDVDTRYHRSWGSEVLRGSRNREISHESQAEGIAFEIVTNEYQLSDKQRQAVWRFHFERLRTARENYDAIHASFERRFPSFWVDELGDRLEQDVIGELGLTEEQRRAFRAFCRRLQGLGPYGGYLHPLRPEDTQRFWDYFREAPAPAPSGSQGGPRL